MEKCSYGNEQSYIFQVRKVLQAECFEEKQFAIWVFAKCKTGFTLAVSANAASFCF